MYKFTVIVTALLLSLCLLSFAENKSIDKNDKNNKIEKIYAPVLYFDSKEKCPLTSVEKYIDSGISLIGYRGKTPYKVINQRIKIEDMKKYLGQYVNLDNQKLELAFQTNNKISESENVVYTRRLMKGNTIYLQYWFLYSFNDVSQTGGYKFMYKCGNHQADWEHISFKINNEKYKKAKNTKEYLNAIEEIFFAQHHKGQHDNRKYKKITDKDISFINTHIKAFPARGTHATFYKSGSYDIGGIWTFKLFDTADGKGKVLYSEKYLSDINSNSWNKYGGRWGEITDDYCNIAEKLSKASNDGELGPLQQNNGNDWSD